MFRTIIAIRHITGAISANTGRSSIGTLMLETAIPTAVIHGIFGQKRETFVDIQATIPLESDDA